MRNASELHVTVKPDMRAIRKMPLAFIAVIDEYERQDGQDGGECDAT